MAASEIVCKSFVHIRCEKASFRIVKDSVWLQLIYSLTTIVFLFVKYLFLDRCRQSKLTTSECCRKIFIGQISHYGKFKALHKLVSIVLQLTHKIM